MNWADFLFGIATGLCLMFAWIVAGLLLAVKYKKWLTSFAMKRMMKASMKGANANH